MVALTFCGFWCKAGRHRSFAALTMFLMWVTRVHEPRIFLNEVSQRRNRGFPNKTPCQVQTHEELAPGKGQIPFGDVLPAFKVHLDLKEPDHAWDDI